MYIETLMLHVVFIIAILKFSGIRVSDIKHMFSSPGIFKAEEIHNPITRQSDKHLAEI